MNVSLVRDEDSADIPVGPRWIYLRLKCLSRCLNRQRSFVFTMAAREKKAKSHGRFRIKGTEKRCDKETLKGDTQQNNSNKRAQTLCECFFKAGFKGILSHFGEYVYSLYY